MKKSLAISVLTMLMLVVFSNTSFATPDKCPIQKTCISQHLGDAQQNVTISTDDYIQYLLQKDANEKVQLKQDSVIKAKTQQALYYYDHHQCPNTSVGVFVLAVLGGLAIFILSIVGIVYIINN